MFFTLIYLLWRNEGMLQWVWVCVSEDSTWELVLALHLLDPGDRTQAILMASALILWAILAAQPVSARTQIFYEIWNFHGWNANRNAEIKVHGI